MKSRELVLTLLAAITVGCGGGKPGQTVPTTPPIDPSGNWAMTATDSNGNSIKLAALFNQVGAVVSANSFTAVDNPLPFNCVPFSATMANGLVQNVNQFSGDVTFTYDVDFPTNMTLTSGTFHFAATLNPQGTSFSGTYSNLPACSGLAASGTITGSEMPSMAGSWSGTLQQVDSFDTRNPIGSALPIVLSLKQDDASGIVTGSYTVQNSTSLSSGTVEMPHHLDQDILSGTFVQFETLDQNGNAGTVAGTLGLDGSLNAATMITVIIGNVPIPTISF